MGNFSSLSPRVRVALGVLAALILALLVFHAGVVVGARHHPREAGAPRGWGLRAPGLGRVGLPHGFIEHGHGAVGTIESVASSSLVLKTRGGSTEAVRLATTTALRSASGTASSTTLAPGQRVIVLGTPGADGTLVAEAIRVFTK